MSQQIQNRILNVHRSLSSPTTICCNDVAWWTVYWTPRIKNKIYNKSDHNNEIIIIIVLYTYISRWMAGRNEAMGMCTPTQNWSIFLLSNKNWISFIKSHIIGWVFVVTLVFVFSALIGILRWYSYKIQHVCDDKINECFNSVRMIGVFRLVAPYQIVVCECICIFAEPSSHIISYRFAPLQHFHNIHIFKCINQNCTFINHHNWSSPLKLSFLNVTKLFPFDIHEWYLRLSSVHNHNYHPSNLIIWIRHACECTLHVANAFEWPLRSRNLKRSVTALCRRAQTNKITIKIIIAANA